MVSLESMLSPYKAWTHNCQEGSTIESIEMDSDIKQADLELLKSIEDVTADLSPSLPRLSNWNGDFPRFCHTKSMIGLLGVLLSYQNHYYY